MHNGTSDKALILVDIQQDFLPPQGALAVPDGEAVVPVAIAMCKVFQHTIATQDWHPPKHQSFASQHPGKKPGDLIDLHGLPQVMWPDHCVQGTLGAQLCRTWPQPANLHVVRKGEDSTIDSYSGFFDNGQRRATELEPLLRKLGVKHVYVMGLATDYCVKFTALDAVRLGFTTTLISDGCRGVNLKPKDSEQAIDEMKQAGVVVTTSAALLAGELRNAS